MQFDETYLAIDLDVVDENFSAISNKAKCKVMTVLKADAYGFGSVPLAKHLQSRSDYFGVAYISEALELRAAGITLPILILGHTPVEFFPEAICQGIRPAIFRMDDARAFSAEAVRQGVRAPVHIALDTGMSRIGFQADEEGIEHILEISRLPGVYIEGLFSHYAYADMADPAPAMEQSRLFNSVREKLTALGVEIPVYHLSNSAALMHLPEQYDMVRVGMILHGMYPSEEMDPADLPVRPTFSWHSRITMLKTLPAGRKISYGGTCTLTDTTRVATVPVGYADGYPRSLSNNFYALVRGKKAPILGRVCMDQMMVDVTNIPDAAEGDCVTLIGTDGNETITPEALCRAGGVFHYEFVCGLARRQSRYYLKDGKVFQKVSYLSK